VEVTIRDDGIGMASLREGSLGYGLIRSLVGQIDGELDVRNEEGLSVSVTFPVPEHPGDDAVLTLPRLAPM
jgi:two-component sensor histidine kinase